MNRVEYAGGQRNIGCAEVDSEVEGGGLAVADWCDGGTVVVAVERDIGRWDSQWCQCMNFVIWTTGRLGIHGYFFDNVSAGDIVDATGADRIIWLFSDLVTRDGNEKIVGKHLPHRV